MSDELVRVPGIAPRAAGKAVGVRIAISGPAAPTVVVEDVVHVVASRGRWAWILPPARLADYEANRCGESPVSAA